jgi:hypothetical protein
MILIPHQRKEKEELRFIREVNGVQYVIKDSIKKVLMLFVNKWDLSLEN